MIGIMIDDNKQHLNEVITTLLFILKLKREEAENKVEILDVNMTIILCC